MTAMLTALLVIFAELSWLAFGGGNSILPEMQRRVVEVQHWMTPAEFSALFALAQAAPGPNLMIAPLIGWQIAGPAGLLVASIGMFGPSSILTAIVLGVWGRFKNRPWRRIVQAGLVPMTVGLVASGAVLIARTTDTGWGLAAITGVAALASLNRRIHPLLVLAVGAGLGLAGLAGL